METIIKSKYDPIRNLEIGKSHLFPYRDDIQARNIRQSVYRIAYEQNKVFSIVTRVEDEKGFVVDQVSGELEFDESTSRKVLRVFRVA